MLGPTVLSKALFYPQHEWDQCRNILGRRMHSEILIWMRRPKIFQQWGYGITPPGCFYLVNLYAACNGLDGWTTWPNIVNCSELLREGDFHSRRRVVSSSSYGASSPAVFALCEFLAEAARTAIWRSPWLDFILSFFGPNSKSFSSGTIDGTTWDMTWQMNPFQAEFTRGLAGKGKDEHDTAGNCW